jgi:DNA-directed RNA polymerase subunit RPC12/RpoP
MPKVEIHLKITVSSDRLDVNQVIALFQEIETQVRPALVAGYLKASQDLVLDQVLGPKWEDKPQEEAPWSCPQCQSRLGFKRRGSRPRTLRKSSLGKLPFQLRQVTCCGCGSTFSPFSDWFGLEPYQASTSEFQAKAVEVACQTSYARSVALVRDLARVDVSATAVHSWVQSQSKEVELDATQADDRPLILDSTRVRAGKNRRGCNLNLGIAIERRRWVGGRPQLEIHPVCFGVDETWTQTGQALTRQSPSRLVYDGDKDVTYWAQSAFPEKPQQRCTWHLIGQLYRHLWEDGLKKREARVWVQSLQDALHDPQHSVSEARTLVKAITQQIRQLGLDHSAVYLAGAEPYVFTYREQPDGMFFDERRQEPLAISATSPVERQMREINRRTDVGARWRVSGVANLIRLDLVRRFEPEQWRSLWRLPQPVSAVCSDVKSQVRVSVRPPLNVMTT